MPNISLTLPEVEQAVVRPSVFDIIRQVQEVTKIDPNTKIFFPGDIQTMQTPGSGLDGSKDRFPIFNTDKYLFIEVEEKYDESAVRTTPVGIPEHDKVFHDPKLGIYIAPVYVSTDVTINFKFRSPSKTEALRWRDDIRLKVSQMRDINLHNISYHYALPLELLVLIKFIWEKREAVEGYNQSLEEYVLSNSTDRLTSLGDITKNDVRLAIRETQARIQGFYDFNPLPEKPEREDDKGVWTITFAYKFSYDKPIACNMKYPVMIHNQLLPPNYTEFTNSSYDLNKIKKRYSISIDALNGFESDTIMDALFDPNSLLRIPEFDDFNIKETPNNTASIFIALSEVDETDKRSLFNLSELGDIVIDEDILQFIRESEYPYVGQLYRSCLYFNLYINDKMFPSGTLECDNQLNIKCVSDLNLRNNNRVRMSIITDFSLIHPAALERLRNYPKAFVKIIGSINNALKNHVDFNNLAHYDTIGEYEYRVITQLLTGNFNNSIFSNPSGTPQGRTWYGPGLGYAEFRDNNIDKQYVDKTPISQINIESEIPLEPGYVPGTSPINSSNNIPGTVPSTRTIPKNSQIGLFRNIDPVIIERYRVLGMSMKTIQLTGIIALHQDELK